LVLPEGRAAFRFEPVGTKILNKISEKNVVNADERTENLVMNR
jgi:hypothetical protein